MRIIKALILVVATLGLMACSWVKLSQGGEKVRILNKSAVASCKKLGSTNVTVTDKVIGLQRKEDAIQENLDVLARNAGANMGGDTIVPMTPVQDGKQTFDVYLCNQP